jgi:hypothetical protein
LQAPKIEISPGIQGLKRELVFELRKTKLHAELFQLAVKECYRKPDLEVFLNICLNDIYFNLVD